MLQTTSFTFRMSVCFIYTLRNNCLQFSFFIIHFSTHQLSAHQVMAFINVLN